MSLDLVAKIVASLVAVALAIQLVLFVGIMRESKKEWEFRKIFGFTPLYPDELREARQALQPLIDRKILRLAASIAAAREALMATEVIEPSYQDVMDGFTEAEMDFQKACKLAKTFDFSIPSAETLYATITVGL